MNYDNVLEGLVALSQVVGLLKSLNLIRFHRLYNTGLRV